jgi:hypothetical protein
LAKARIKLRIGDSALVSELLGLDKNLTSLLPVVEELAEVVAGAGGLLS